jgi:hypothetical protein
VSTERAHTESGSSPPEIIIEQIVITPDAYLSIKALAGYSSLSTRQIKTLIADPINPIPVHRFGKRVAVRMSDFDTWASQYRRVGHTVVEEIEAAKITSKVRMVKQPRRLVRRVA